MEKFFVLLLLPTVYAAALGWGRGLERLLYRDSLGCGPYSVALGLLLWLVVGAFLNLASLARPLAFDLILLSGLVLAVVEWRRHAFSFSALRLNLESVPGIVAFAVAGFFAWTLLPAAAFNHHDDFFKYLPRLVRMLEIGTLGGNPFGFVGFDSLGMQTFLQGFFVSHVSFKYVNAFDMVFCLALAGLLLDALGRNLGVHWFIRSMAVVALLVLNPQYVNISALYSSIAMIVGLSLATYFWVRGFQADQRSRSTLSAIPLGLFIAAIAGLKVTLIPYAGSYLLVLLFFLLSRAETRQVGFRSVLPILASATALGLSWAALAWDTIERLLSMAWHKFQLIVGRWVENVEATALAGNLDRFHGICANGSAGDGKDTYFHEIVTRGELLYGGHIFHYLGIVALIAVLTLLFMVFLYRRPKNQLLLLPAATMGLTCLLSVAGILIGVYGIHIDALVRYNAQVLVAVLPVLSLFCFAVFAGENKNLFKQAKTLATTAGVLLMLGVPVGAQAGLWVERTRVAIQERHNISYPLSQSSLRAMDQLLSENVQNWAVGVQKKIPVGARVLSWVSVPFYFDFERNPIFTLAAPSRFEGISKISKPMRQAWLKKQLQDARVEYIVWEYKGSKKERGYKDKEALIQTLGGLAITERILYKNTNWVLIKLMGL